MIKLNKESVSEELSKIKSSGEKLTVGKNSEVNLPNTNLQTFKEYVVMFEDYHSAIKNYKSIVNEDVTSMEKTVEEIVQNDQEIAEQFNSK